MARPALAVVTGDAEPCAVTLRMAIRLIEIAQEAFGEAATALTDHADGPGRAAARERFDAALERLMAALNRRDRLVAESVGERWLWVAGGAR